MSANVRNNSVSSILSNLFKRQREVRRKRKSLANGRSRTLQMEGLEKREMFAISSLGVTAGALQIWTDNNATSVTVSPVGSNYRVSEVGTSRTWDYAASSIGRLDFIGGAGNDRFVNNVSTLTTRAWGQGGNDYLEGYNAIDEFFGGEGNDTLVGYGGNDVMRGGNGNDVIRGMAGADYIVGEGGHDYIDGGSENDQMWGGDGEDTLLGGTGDDQMVGDNGNDQLNGQAGVDRMWGVEGSDVMISIDGAFTDYVDSGNGYDTLWVDGISSPFFNISDNTPGVSSTDVVQKVGSFANGADLTLDGDNLADPTDIGAKLRFSNNITADNIRGSNPLFAESGVIWVGGSFPLVYGGPTSSDINQGNLGDCWLLAGLGSVAGKNQNLVRQNVVDFNDGTYGVRLGNNFYRVDNELGVVNTASGAVAANVQYAALGAQNSMWVAIVEKAFTHYRSGANTYASIAGGFSTEVYTAFRMRNVGAQTISTYWHSAIMAADMYSKWTQGYALSIGSIAVTGGGTHAFGVERFVLNAAGTVTDVVLRNPWATDSLNSFTAFASANSGTSTTDGLFTVSVAQLYSSGGTVRWGQV